MNWIKSILAVILVSLFTLKVADITFGTLIDLEKTGVTWDASKILIRSDRRTINLREFDPGQKAIVYPTDEYMKSTDSLEQKGYNVVIDGSGFISNGNAPIEPNLETIKILFLGGSTTESVFVTEKNRFPSIVERNLRSSFQKNISTLNAGVSGNHSMHSLIKLLGVGIKEKPSFALMMHNINDLALLKKTGSYWNAEPAQKLLIDQKSAKENPITMISILRYIKSILAPNLYGYLKVRLFPNFNPGSNSADSKVVLQKSRNFEESKVQFKSSIVSFIEICKAWNIEPILLTQFNRIRDGDKLLDQWVKMALPKHGLTKKEFISHYQEFNEIVRVVSYENNVELIDLDSLIPKDRRYMYDIVHLNDQGSNLVAEILSSRLTDILRAKFP